MASFGLPIGERLQAAAEWLAYDAALKGLDVADAAKRLVDNFGEWIRPYLDEIVEGARAYHPTVQQELRQFGVELGEFGTSANESEEQIRKHLPEAFKAREVKLAAPARRPRRVQEVVAPELPALVPAVEVPPRVSETPQSALNQAESGTGSEATPHRPPIQVPRYITPVSEEVPPQSTSSALPATTEPLHQKKVTLTERVNDMPPGTKYAGVLFALLLIAITIAPPIGEASTYGRCVFTGYHFLFTPPDHYSQLLVLDTHRIILEIILAAAISFVFGVVFSLKGGKTPRP